MKFHEITILEEASRCLMCYDAPCSKACPAGSDPAAFIKAIRLSNLRGGARQTLDGNMFGAVCAAACPASKYCEGACIRKKIDHPVEISMLHSFITQYGQECGFPQIQLFYVENSKLTVAVLGANMAGLTAAAELAKKGVSVTVYTNSTKPFCNAQMRAQMKEGKADSAILDTMMSTLNELGITFLTIKKSTVLAEEFQKYGLVVIAEKDCVPNMANIEKFQGAFFTGEYVPGPNDLTFSVKKGKETARCVLAYADQADTSAKEENK
ncbi:MAG TPA: NAD(P)-binding protein [Oscillospiraceae bacterium]|nr:NAD(P)-binding protein [Oscillospiraceae bacterium]